MIDSPQQTPADADAARLRADVDALTAAMGTLVDYVEQRTAGGGQADRAGPSRWAWRYAGADDAGELWAELRDFVDWLNGRYSLDSERQVPPCWYRHPVAVEELTALMASWQHAYHGPDAPHDGLLAWHAQWLWGCLDRLPVRSGWQRCRGGRHHERSAAVQCTDDDFADFVREAGRDLTGAEGRQ